MSGVFLISELKKQQREKGSAGNSAPLTLLLSNPRAVATCRRYMDMDLNRCFTTTALSVPVRLVLLNVPLSDAFSLESVSKYGMSLEVGPQPQGVIRADIFTIMKQGVDAMLDWTESFNSGNPENDIQLSSSVRADLFDRLVYIPLGKVFEGGEVEAYFIQRSVDYPRDPETGKPSAAVHPQLQDRDFCLLQHGDPVFLTFSGETLNYEEEEPLHPVFINEAAYYEKGIAFHLARRQTLSLPSLQAQRDEAPR
ncbi:N-acyl-aromatic-L-amino acid amidohydrolase (carboxylate-forming) B [Bagarius yarrelli]|uniref:N-acyl-aromatic-L-amino acid amidohydrolase (Carboxylate-forming) B n=1 Tax=Bagarius yarrelli TaxID=175774 RepID=A0A556VWF1_BAGYA|nr:N-acyl-aromatic-L-amino acid amidohydrolase (carboxylate-forming) B [Bagarius yarrelli]